MKLRKLKYKTFLQYFLSYIALLIVSLTGILILVNVHIKQEMRATYEKQSVTRLENLSDQVGNLLMNLNYTAFAIDNNFNLLYSRYNNTDYTRMTAIQELAKYSNGNSIMQAIIYLDLKNKQVYSVHVGAVLDDETLYLTPSGRYNKPYPIPYHELLKFKDSQITTFPGEGSTDDSLLVYSPAQQSESYAILFLLNRNELNKLLSMGVSPDIPAVALTNSDGNILTATDRDKFAALPNETQTALAGDQNVESGALLKFPIHTPALTLVATFDGNTLETSIFNAFRTVYLGILIIGVLGILLSVLFLKVTYFPLHQLATRIFNMHPAQSAGGDISLIRSAFETIQSENQQLLQKIRNYRVLIQKSILDSLAPSTDEPAQLSAYIDSMFDSGVQNHFLVLCFHSMHGLGADGLLPRLEEILPQNARILPLENTPEQVSCLLNFPGPARPDIEELAKTVRPLDCRVSFSDLSANPLDIARLYNNASVAAHYSEEKFNFYDKPSLEGQYPYQLFDRLAADLQAFRFEDSTQKVQALFASLKSQNNPEFFIRCTLIDTITLIVGAMNTSDLSFNLYSERYYDLLYLCRNSDFAASGEEIQRKTIELIAILAEHVSESSLHVTQIRQFIEENCFSPDFSVAMTADHFGITTAYMSYLFKKKFSDNFTDFVWNIRLARAQELLRGSDLPIEKIGAFVGYENSSSFRRKFKESTGVSPSQYRSQGQGSSGTGDGNTH